MRYTLTHWAYAARAPAVQGVHGYLYNHGGLNNQKMALIGLLLSGITDRQPINLPYIYNRDQRTEQEYVARIEDVFELDRILDFAARHDLTVLAECPGGERGGWDYFGRFHEFIANAGTTTEANMILDAVTCLTPRIVADPAFLQLRDFLRGSLGIDTVVQLRIEHDWRAHAENLRRIIGDSEDNGIDFAQILMKVRKTFPLLRLIYATSDEKSLPAPKDAIRTVSRDKFGIDLLWKADLLSATLIEQLTPLDLSLIDYEIAKATPKFIGLTSSTFANMLAFEKFAAARKPVRGHYIYNCQGDAVQERKDNGCAANALAAMSPSRFEGLLSGTAQG